MTLVVQIQYKYIFENGYMWMSLMNDYLVQTYECVTLLQNFVKPVWKFICVVYLFTSSKKIGKKNLYKIQMMTMFIQIIWKPKN